jgi:hypothetical protein
MEGGGEGGGWGCLLFACVQPSIRRHANNPPTPPYTLFLATRRVTPARPARRHAETSLLPARKKCRGGAHESHGLRRGEAARRRWDSLRAPEGKERKLITENMSEEEEDEEE